MYASNHCGEFADLEIEGFKRELKLIPAPVGNTNPNLKSESLSTLLSPVQQLSKGQHDHLSESLSDSDHVWQTILQYMNTDFQMNWRQLNKLAS